VINSGIYPQQKNTFPRLKSDPEIESLTKEDPYTADELFAVALWASGADSNPSYTAAYYEKFEAIKAALSDGIPNDKKERAEYILNYLHKNVFTNYSLNQTRLDTLLTNGRYNCVSSAVLYTIMASNFELDARGVVTKDHAFALINFDDGPIDVETTNSYGFDPGKKKEFTDNFGKATGFAYTSPGNYRNRQTISLIELISLIQRNRIADLEKANKFADAVPLAIDRAAFFKERHDTVQSALFGDPSTESDDAIFNLGAFYLNRGNEKEALAWADYSKDSVRDKKREHEFVLAVVNNIIAKELRSKKIEAAQKTLIAEENRFTQEETNKFKGMILDAELTQVVNSSKDGEATLKALKQIEDAEKTGFIETKRIAAFKSTVVKNRIAYFHNNFAKLFNKKDYSNAQLVLETALKEFPSNKQFLQDQTNLKKVMK
jgi:hypothetical protein